MNELVAPSINLAILLGVLFYYLREPLKKYVSSRHENLREELAAVRKQLSEAQAQHAEFSGKLRAIDAEIAALRAEARQDAQNLKANIAADTQRAAAAMVAEARTSAQNLLGDLQTQLVRELGNQVLDRAEKIIREKITADDRARIRHEFSQQMEKSQ